ncbi:hypothetical protein [Devosia sp. SD17-2]|uniref:hypothetical protein n=1 Tax=Devosia sp. SD17-2 TaxID=2976459 RepID=UPI0023D824F0|nr:hypothetical protein [Devosia sp. SD17-2]WEJ32184.1 hypothetical protein NYQ88_14915 [Devosia sp. SD17-2]
MATIPPNVNADQPNMVHEAEVAIGQHTLKARYFVEGGTVVAKIGDKTYQCFIGTLSAAEIVQALLKEIAESEHNVGGP